MTLLLSSCGKKAGEEAKNNGHGFVPTDSSIKEEITTTDLLIAIRSNDFEKVQKLLWKSSRLDLNEIQSDGETLLTTAVKRNAFQIVDLLIEYDVSPSKANQSQETPLMVAAKSGYENLVKYFLSLEVKLDNKDLEGNTALLLSIIHNHENVAILLINNRANIDITNDQNQNALYLAELMGMQTALELLIAKSQSGSGLPTEEIFLGLLLNGEVKIINPILTKHPGLVHIYAHLNPYVVVLQNRDHDTALSITHLLMSYNADVNGPLNASTTPLIESVKSGFMNFVNIFLVDGRANPNVQDKDGKTALIWAIEKNDVPMATLLMEKGAMKKYKNAANKTVKGCTVARDVKKTLKTQKEKDDNEKILDLLGCGLRWLF